MDELICTSGEGSGDEELSKAVLGYLAEHPSAMDTLQGIAEWWIARHQIRVDVQRLDGTLRALAQRGVLEEIGSGDYKRYRLKVVPSSLRQGPLGELGKGTS